MSEIWIGEHLSLRMPIVVKLMKPRGEGVAEYVERFAREARAVARLRSPHVVSILDYGADDGTPFIVMELLEGTDLLELLQRRPRLEPGEATTLVDQVAKALGVAHAVGITHRDIKPRNLFLATAGEEDVVLKVLDFGIAGMSASERITAADAVLGSPFYMSPEQLRSMPLDPQVDLWALAVVAFRLVTGELPFEGETVVEVCERIMRFERRRVPPTTPRAELLDSFFARAFARSPAERFSSVKDLADTFRRIAGPPSAIDHLLDMVPDAPTLESRRNDDIIERVRQRRARQAEREMTTTDVTPLETPTEIRMDDQVVAPVTLDDAPTFVEEPSTFVPTETIASEPSTTSKMTALSSSPPEPAPRPGAPRPGAAPRPAARRGTAPRAPGIATARAPVLALPEAEQAPEVATVPTLPLGPVPVPLVAIPAPSRPPAMPPVPVAPSRPPGPLSPSPSSRPAPASTSTPPATISLSPSVKAPTPTFGPRPPIELPRGLQPPSTSAGFDDSTDVRRQLGIGPPAWQLIAGFLTLVVLATIAVYAVIR